MAVVAPLALRIAAKRIAEVLFDTAGRKRLLIKVAPITKL